MSSTGPLPPLIFSTTGGAGKENGKFLKRLAALIAQKRNEEYSIVMSYLRRKLTFALLRTTLIAVRGTRTPIPKRHFRKQLSEVDINLVEYLNF